MWEECLIPDNEHEILVGIAITCVPDYFPNMRKTQPVTRSNLAAVDITQLQMQLSSLKLQICFTANLWALMVLSSKLNKYLSVALEVTEAKAIKQCWTPSERSVTFISGVVTRIQNTVQYNELLQIEVLMQQNTDTSSCATCTSCLWGLIFMGGEIQIHTLSHTFFFLLRSTYLSVLVRCVWYTNPDRTTSSVRESTERRRCKTVAHQTHLEMINHVKFEI